MRRSAGAVKNRRRRANDALTQINRPRAAGGYDQALRPHASMLDVLVPPAAIPHIAMKINQISVEAALASLNSSRRGLASAEAARRRAEYGGNRLEKIEHERAWRRLLRQFTGFFALILWVAAALALVAQWRDPESGMAPLAAAIVGVIVINGAFSFWQ